ncbi:MAG: FHA domain-containing protein [Acidimicrobiales bacterium]
MLTNVQVVPGATSVARYHDVLVWFETGPQGGGVMLTQLLQAVQAVASGSVPPRQMGARLAAVLNTGDATAVPALVAAAPDDEGLRVVVHGWGVVVADGLRVPNGWVDQVIAGRRSFFLGRNTTTPVAPMERSALNLEDGIVPGEGVSFNLAPRPATTAPGAGAPAAPPSAPAPADPRAGDPQAGAPAAATPPAPDPVPSVPAAAPAPGPPPVAWPPPGAPSAGPPARPTPPPTTPPPHAYGQVQPPSGGPAAAASPPGAALGRLVLDDGSSAVLERTCVLGSAPQSSPAVQTGVAVPLTVAGAGIGAVHAEIRVEEGRVAVRDLGGGPTHVQAAGAPGWTPLAPGQLTPLLPGTRIALGQRTIAYERP